MNLHNNNHNNWTVLRYLATAVLWKVAREIELIYFHLHFPQCTSNLATLHKSCSHVHQLYTHNAPVVYLLYYLSYHYVQLCSHNASMSFP